jgi:hypothetical protein
MVEEEKDDVDVDVNVETADDDDGDDDDAVNNARVVCAFNFRFVVIILKE